MGMQRRSARCSRLPHAACADNNVDSFFLWPGLLSVTHHAGAPGKGGTDRGGWVSKSDALCSRKITYI